MRSWSKWFREHNDFVSLTIVAVFFALLGAMPDISSGSAAAYIVSWGLVLTLALMTLLAIRQKKWGMFGLLMAFALYMVLGGADHIPFQAQHIWGYGLVALCAIFFYETWRPDGWSDQFDAAFPATDD